MTVAVPPVQTRELKVAWHDGPPAPDGTPVTFEAIHGGTWGWFSNLGVAAERGGVFAGRVIAYLQKPFPTKLLMDAIEAALRRDRSNDACSPARMTSY